MYPQSNLASQHYHNWEGMWPTVYIGHREHGFHDYMLHEEFPWSERLHAGYEMEWRDGQIWTQATRVYWWAAPLVAFLYLGAVFVGQKIMVSKKAYDLKIPLAGWNLFLAVFSIIGTIRLVPHLFYGLIVNPHTYFFCRAANEAFGGRGSAGLWVNLFVWSKYIELIDTAFLVLRKKPVSFLHWFHHATVLMYCWHASQYHMPTGIIFATMNYIVHSIMYFYYFLAAVTKPPKWGKLVTILQIVQMFIGMFVTGYHYYLLNTLRNCDGSYRNLFAAAVMYTAYMLLFVQFFVGRYTARPAARSSGKKKKE
jgi:hypothetical protein